MNVLSLPNPLGLVFDDSGTRAFAELSGDYNPLHVDPVAARRLLFGSTVAHGVHVLLKVLEQWADAVIPGERWSLSSLDVSFDRPVRTGCEVSFQIKPAEIGHAALNVFVENQVAIRLKFSWHLTSSPEAQIDFLPRNPDPAPPRQLLLRESTTEAGNVPLHLDLSSANRLIPGLAVRFSRRQIALLLATTRLVGMVYPGLHSIYSRLRLNFSSNMLSDDTLRYEVTQLDSRFHTATLRIDSGEANGEVVAFFRPEPCLQTGVRSLELDIGSSEFSGQRALIIGGSRGLGEVTARILARGGAQVLLSYSSGEDDARRIVDEITIQGGSAICFQWDARNSDDNMRQFFSPAGDSPSHLYYFATPRIATGRKGHFSPAIFHDFCEFYLTALNKLMEKLPDLKGLFYPSSVFVDDVPANFAEYAAAKAAGETLCQFYGRTRPSLSVLCPRLPRLATDQTHSLMGKPAPDPALILLPLFRDWRQRN